jgi:hypothetical protein
VPCLTCLHCNTSSLDDVILHQYQSNPNIKVTLLPPEVTAGAF